MSNYNDFDLDIRSTQNAGSVGPQSVPLTKLHLQLYNWCRLLCYEFTVHSWKYLRYYHGLHRWVLGRV